MEKIKFDKSIIVLGYGTIAKATIPLIRNHFEIDSSQIKILSCPGDFEESDQALGYIYLKETITREDYQELLGKVVSPGDLIVNLTAEVSSIDLIRYCSQHGILYLDTCIEMWADEVTPGSRTYDERELLLDLKERLQSGTPTALSSIGANPGTVSLLTKRLIFRISEELGNQPTPPKTKREWAVLARDLTVKAIHVNERDTQQSTAEVGPNDFYSTWSVAAMIMESIESAEMAIGSHETGLPDGAHYCGNKNKRDIYFDISGKDLKISTWLPLAGEIRAMILNHNEPYSIAELYTIEDENGVYSPTVCFAYHPCDQTMTSLENLTTDNYRDLEGRLLLHDIVDGRDELGVFVLTERHGSFWLGSRLDIHTARKMNPQSSATSLQVAAGVIAGMCWVATNPNEGVVEPEDITNHDYLLDIAEPYWGGFIFAKSKWTPDNAKGGHALQFENFIKKSDDLKSTVESK